MLPELFAKIRATKTATKAAVKPYLTRAEREAAKVFDRRLPRQIVTDMPRAVLIGLQADGMHVYQGTADPKAVARRRTAAKRARATRAANARRGRK